MHTYMRAHTCAKLLSCWCIYYCTPRIYIGIYIPLGSIALVDSESPCLGAERYSLQETDNRDIKYWHVKSRFILCGIHS